MKRNFSNGKLRIGVKPHPETKASKIALNSHPLLHLSIKPSNLTLNHQQPSQNLLCSLENRKTLHSFNKNHLPVSYNRLKTSSCKENTYNRFSQPDFCQSKAILQRQNQTKSQAIAIKEVLDQFVTPHYLSQYCKQKNSQLQLPIKSLYIILEELISKFILHQKFKIQQKPHQPSTLEQKQKNAQGRKKRLKIELAVDLQLTIKKQKKLKIQPQNVQISLYFTPLKYESEIVWLLCDRNQKQQLTQEDLQFLLNRMRILTSKIRQQEAQEYSLAQHLQTLQQTRKQKQELLHHLELSLQNIQKQVEQQQKYQEEMNSYLQKQPNQLLREEVQEYKQHQQELFDLAYFFDITAPEKIDLWIGQTIKHSEKTHELTLKMFCNRQMDRNHACTITQTELEHFKQKMETAHNTVVNNLQKILKERVDKIKLFVSMMQKIARNTVAKRQYLQDINTRMATAKVHFQKTTQHLEHLAQQHFPQIVHQKNIVQTYQTLKKITENMEDLYLKAEIFY